MKYNFIPNTISILRMLLVWPFLYYLLIGHYQFAFYLFILAGLSDGVDGFLARRFQWTSGFGSFVDPLADKLLLIVNFVALAYLEQLPIWFVYLVVLRDITIMSGAGAFYYLFGQLEFQPSWISKCNTVLQILLVFLVLFELAYYPLPLSLVQTILLFVVFSTSLSLIQYVWVWSRRAYLQWGMR